MVRQKDFIVPSTSSQKHMGKAFLKRKENKILSFLKVYYSIPKFACRNNTHPQIHTKKKRAQKAEFLYEISLFFHLLCMIVRKGIWSCVLVKPYSPMQSSSLADEMFSSSPVADELLPSVWWMAWGEQQALFTADSCMCSNT